MGFNSGFKGLKCVLKKLGVVDGTCFNWLQDTGQQGRLDGFDTIGHRARREIRALVIFKNSQCDTTQSFRTHF